MLYIIMYAHFKVVGLFFHKCHPPCRINNFMLTITHTVLYTVMYIILYNTMYTVMYIILSIIMYTVLYTIMYYNA